MSVERNIAANFLGNAWIALVQIAFVPLYIRYLGIEAYGLIGIHATLQVLLSLLDMGLTQTLVREMARFNARALSVGEVRTLLRTVELVFLGLGLIIFVSVVIAAPWLAVDWLRVETLPVSTVVEAFYLMAAVIALRWLAGLYRGVIMGLQHVVWLNATGAAFATVRGAGVVVVLIWMSPTIKAFFLFQSCVALIEVVILFRKSWHLLPSHGNASFSKDALRAIWRFSAGLTMISLLALLLIQTDKIVLSKMLSLKEFGYYVLASSVAASLNLLILPISSVAYPRLVELVVRADQSALTEAYHRFSQMLAIVSAPSGLILAIFSDNILTLWIQDSTTVNAAAPLVTLLAIGFMLNGFMSAPYNLQLAYGNMRFIIALMCILVLIFVPTIYFGALAYGAVAAGYAWIAINLSCIIFAVPVMHKNLTPREKWRWYTQDVALPVGAAFGAAYVVRLLAPAPTIPENWVNLLVVSSAFLFALFAAVFASPLGREMCVRGWLSWESSHPKP